MEPADDSAPAKGGLAGIDYCGLVDPAALAAIGIQQPKGHLPAHAPYVLGCDWTQGSTTLTLTVDLGSQSDLVRGEKQDFSGFAGAARYSDVTNECTVDINIGPDELHLQVGDTSSENEAFSQKRCEVGVDLARQVAAKIKK